MPRLEGFWEYRFVPYGWTHPDGYRFTVITDYLSVEAYAERMERSLIRAKDQVRFCGEFRHTADPGGCCPGLSVAPAPPPCERWLAVCRECTRTNERQQLVRVEIPVPGRN